jgi:hypothetical protein
MSSSLSGTKTIYLGVPCDTTTFGVGNEQAIADALETQATYSGQVVLICWHHGALAQQFVPSWSKKWHGSVFDVILQIDYALGPAVLKSHPQRLLYGDSASADD